MGMKARLRTDSSGNITVHVEGGIEFETGNPFRKQLGTLLKENPSSSITIDMNRLDFVGSSGISHFVETLRILDQKTKRVYLSNVKSEFRRVFKLYDFNYLEMLIEDLDSDDTTELNMKHGNRRHTFQN